MIQIVRQATYKTTQWSGGITREICIFPATASLAARNFDVRISSAVIDTPESNFSDFTGYRRYLMPLNGKIVLYPGASEPQSAAENEAVGEENAVKLSATDLFEFDGAQPMRSRNTPGAIDFNVIVRRDLPITARIALDNCSTLPSGQTILFALLRATTRRCARASTPSKAALSSSKSPDALRASPAALSRGGANRYNGAR